MKTKKLLSILAILVLLLTALPVLSVGAAGTVSVMPSDVGITWLTSDTRAGGASNFVFGPNTAPLGDGSLQMTTTDSMGGSSQAKAQLFNYQFGSFGTPGNGVALADIDEMSYWAFRASTSTNSAAQTISLNMEVDYLGDGSSYTTLVFEPFYNPSQGAMATDTWQMWDAFDSGNAVWWSTKDIPGVCAFNCFVPWSTILTNNPNAEIINAFGFNVGSGWVGDFEGYADELIFGVAGDSTTYDFEPVTQCTSICYADVNTGNDANGGSSPSDAKKTIQAAIDQVDSGGTVIVAAGTYDENLDTAKPLTIQGAGNGTNPSVDTIIDPSGGSYGIFMHQPVNLMDLRVTGAPLHGIRVQSLSGRLDFSDVTWQDIASSSNGGEGVELHNGTDISNMAIINSEFVGNVSQGIRSASDVTIDGLTMTDSLFNQNSYGIYLQGTINNLNISGSSFNDSTNYGAYLSETGPVTTMAIEDSEFNNNSYGLVFYNTQDNSNITISGTEFQSNDKSGMWMYGNTLTDVLIQESNILNNDVSASGAYGINIGVYGGVMNNVAVHYSNITGHTIGGGLMNGSGSETTQVDGSCNWWGAADGPSGSGMGSGDAVTDYVTFTPWLISAAPDGPCTGMPDNEGPVTTNVVADPNPNPAAVGTSITVTANVDDTTTGGSNIASAEYSLDNGLWTAMSASDSAFDEISEDVAASFVAPSEPGIYDLCVRGTDEPGNVGGPECIMFVVYDPSGGFVTGGGWIDSPAGAMPPTLTNVTISGVSGDTSVDPDAVYASYYLRYVGNPPPAGYDPSHNYQWGSPAIFTPSPEDGPVTLTGSIDVDGQTVGQVAMIGLLDRDDLAAGNSSFQLGAYIYVYRSSATSWRIGITDGNSGGEIVQAFVTIADTDLPSDGVLNVEFTLDGTADGSTCATGPYTTPAGCMTLQVTGGTVNATLTDSYGDIVGGNSASPEFANGAVPGWDDYLGSNVGYTLTVPSLLSGSPEGKATFGFVSKYKKGASVPTGNTEFQFKAGDLNFHSTSYDWLVVTGSDFAKFKGTGTINGEGTYKFQIWAGDGTGSNGEDEFRIKIWYEDGGSEVVVYDNGMNQAIGGGSIVVHKAKK